MKPSIRSLMSILGAVCRVPGWVARPILGVSLFALTFVFSAVPSLLAHEAKDNHVADVRVTETWMIRKGGRMYANWADELDKELPAKTHPSYPKTSKKKGKVTWRCKECHGWDTQGADGAYGTGSHFTGIKGIQGMMGQNPRVIAQIIRDKTHGYTKKMIPDKDMEALALFVSWGQLEMDRYIDRKTRRAAGDVRHGAAIFQTTCAVCHGLDGTLINFGSDKEPEFIGTVASENPWETLHNIRFGHAGDAMIGLIAFPVQDQVDALSYAQTLPTK